MHSKEPKLLDLGDYKRFDFQECIKEKFNTLVLDEGGLSSPLSISLIIPTKFDPEGILEIEEETLKQILAECSSLVDAGFLDEIIIMGATLDEEGEADFSVLENVVKIAYDELGLFREQVDLLNKYKSQNLRAKRGFVDFFLKVVHQFDENLPKLLAKYGVFGATGHFGMLAGKGYGIWLSVPMARGDVICFIDADIMNFRKEFVAGLCYPIIYSWKAQEAAIKFVKAYYSRITVTKKESEKPIFGGRICRLLAIPFLKSVVNSFRLYSGLDNMRYPLAGEFALSRDTIERLSIPNSYAVETSLLFQIYDLVGPTSIAQLDLDIHRHIGRRFERMETMSYHIVDAILRVVDEKLGRPLTNEEKEHLLVSYEETADSLIEQYEKTASTLKKREENLLYSREKDLEKKQQLKTVVYEILSGKSKEKRPRYFSSPSWKRIDERTGNYIILREMLWRRANQSTWSRLKGCGLLGR